jgi:hypothetical protein
MVGQDGKKSYRSDDEINESLKVFLTVAQPHTGLLAPSEVLFASLENLMQQMNETLL